MRVYYNENDPYAAAWLRELISAGHIPSGDVDERSIVDVKPNEITSYTQCHFFAGIGGWSLALRLAGWPDRKPVWTGSCPCQPFSCAGEGLGTDDPRHLWPFFFAHIKACKPSIVFGEQVASAAGRAWLARVFADLETLDYQRAGADLCAASVSAPHIRQRLWWVAYAKRDEQSRKESCDGTHGRMGGGFQPVPWNRDWESALRDFRVVDDGLSYGVEACDGPRNAIVPQVAAEFIQAAQEAIEGMK